MLKWVRTTGRVFGERLEYIQIPLSGPCLMQAALNHGELIVSSRGIVADLDILTEQVLSRRELFVPGAKVGELQQHVSKIRVGMYGLFEQPLGGSVVSLAFLNVANVEQACGVMRIFLEPGFKILSRLVKPAEMAIRESQKSVGASRRI